MATGLPSPLPVGHPACIASIEGDLEGLQRALERMENPNSAKNEYGGTLYYLAALNDHTHIMQWLFSIGGCNPNAQDNDDDTPGIAAMANSHLHAFLLWLHHGGDPNIANKDGMNALHEYFVSYDNTTAVSQALRSCTAAELEAVLEVLRMGYVPAISGVSPTAVAAVNAFLALKNKDDLREADLARVPNSLKKAARTTEAKLDTAIAGTVDAVTAFSAMMEGEVDTVDGTVDAAFTEKVDFVDAHDARLAAITTATLQAVQDTVNHRDIVQTQLQDAENTIANLRRQLHDTIAQLEDAQNAATAADAQHAAAMKHQEAQHTANLQDTTNAHTAIVAELEAELAAARSEAAAAATMRQAAVEDMQHQHGAQLSDLSQLLADAHSQLAVMTENSAALASTVKCVASMVSHREPWPSGITAEAVADIITAGLSSPNTSPPTTLLLHGLQTHSPDAVMAGITLEADLACKAVEDMCQSMGEGGTVCREAGLLAWLVASAHKTDPGSHWPPMTHVIGSLHGVFWGTVEHDDPSGLVERAGRGYMSCDLGRVLGLQALDMLLDMHPEDKYRLVGHLTEDDKIVPREGAAFYAGGRREALTEWRVLCGAEFKEEVIVVDPSRDEALSEMIREAVSAVAGITDLKEKATALAVFVQERLGGSLERRTDIVGSCKEEVAGHCMRSRKLKLGELKLGVCRHRAILYKLLADQAGIDISCRLVRGDLLQDDGVTWEPHAWNVVSVETEPDLEDDEGKTHEYYVVDLMRGATLVPSSSGAGMEYKRSGGGTVGGATLFGDPGDLTAEEVASLPMSAMLGSGSSGIVYTARDGQVVKSVALSSRVSVEYAMREVKVMSVLRHPYLVPLKQHFVFEKHVSMVMPRGDGSLTQLGEIGPDAEVAPLLLQVALGMEHLHGRRRYIVHRDLKPSNIILFKQLGGAVVAKVGDFGSAKASKHGTSLSANTRVCTPGYAAPEQRWEWPDYSTVRVSLASDVYAFGQVMGYMFIGETPSTQPPPQHQYEDAMLAACGMPQSLRTLYQRCTAADADARPTFEAIVAALVREVQAGLVRKALE